MKKIIIFGAVLVLGGLGTDMHALEPLRHSVENRTDKPIILWVHFMRELCNTKVRPIVCRCAQWYVEVPPKSRVEHVGPANPGPVADCQIAGIRILDKATMKDIISPVSIHWMSRYAYKLKDVANTAVIASTIGQEPAAQTSPFVEIVAPGSTSWVFDNEGLKAISGVQVRTEE